MKSVPIPNYDGKYVIDRNGTVVRIKENNYAIRNIKPVKYFLKNDLKYVVLNGAQERLDKLVYKTFVGPIPEGYTLLPKNGIHTDVRLNNLKLHKLKRKKYFNKECFDFVSNFDRKDFCEGS